MKYLILLIISIYSIDSYGQNLYKLKELTISPNENCREKFEECINEFCYLTRIMTDSSYFQGIAFAYGGCHYVWLKEVRYYDSGGSIIDQFIDSTLNMDFVKKASIKQVKEYLNRKNRWIVYHKDGNYESTSYFVHSESFNLR